MVVVMPLSARAIDTAPSDSSMAMAARAEYACSLCISWFLLFVVHENPNATSTRSARSRSGSNGSVPGYLTAALLGMAITHLGDQHLVGGPSPRIAHSSRFFRRAPLCAPVGTSLIHARGLCAQRAKPRGCKCSRSRGGPRASAHGFP